MSDLMIVGSVILGLVAFVASGYQLHHNGWVRGWDDCKRRLASIDRCEKPCELYDETSELFEARTMKTILQI